MAINSEVRPRFTTRLKTALPIIQWLPSYRSEWLRPDVVAGLTLAAYGIPVAVAYSSLAGLPPQAGLYRYLLGGIAYALFGTSRQLAIGPTSAISILIGSAIGAMAAGDAQRQTHLAAGVAILAGDVLQLSGLLVGDVKESRNGNPARDLQMAADRTRPHTLCGPVVSSLFSLAARC